MRLTIRHETAYAYDPPAALAMRLKLWPPRLPCQTVAAWSVTVNGKPATPDFTNGWGDRVATLFRRTALERVEIVAEGVVETVDGAGVLGTFRHALRPGVCLRVTPRTRADAAIAALAEAAAAGGGAPLAQAHALSDLAHARLAYDPAASDPAATAAAALAAGAGVCQDHAHVVIAAARHLGWPARYVVGYLAPVAEARSEGATHAWAEIWVEGLGWIGFDAANGLCPTDAYVRLCAGLDAPDAAPIRGHAEGAPAETMTSGVAVEAAPTEGQTQQ